MKTIKPLKIECEFALPCENLFIDIGKLFSSLGNSYFAIKAYKEALKYNEYNFDALYMCIVEYIETSNISKAAKLISKFSMFRNADVHCLSLLGHIEIRLGDIKKAINYFENALKISKRLTSDLLYGIALIYELIRKYEKAIETYDMILKNDPYNNYSKRIRLRSAICLKNLCKYDIACQEFNQLLKFGNYFRLNREIILIHLAHLYVLTGKYHEAIKIFSEFKSKNINNNYINIIKICMLFKKKRFLELLQTIKEDNIRNHPYIYYILGRTYFMLKRYNESIIAYNHGLKYDSENFQCWNSMGISQLAVGAYKNAYACFSKSIELNTNFHEGIHNYSIMLEYFGDKNLLASIEIQNNISSVIINQLLDVTVDLKNTPYLTMQSMLVNNEKWYNEIIFNVEDIFKH
ncbi:General transcriptional corepressor trfA [Astathelohania contejeani]|uniref:General transcriptional corepressor trfA n=1 Tax=Astathelohania contejeani TaxID=164912 RepID=A0ABQ7HVJ0_9MICR|nr:General transcriptional corepressor trfA [Thelohania contejeani]